MPAQALADGFVPGGVGDVIDETAGIAGDAAGSATDTAGDVIDEAAGSAGDAAGSATDTAGDLIDETTGTVDEVVDDVGGAANDVTEGADDVAGTVGGSVDAVTGSSGQTVASGPTASSNWHGGGGSTEPEPGTGTSGTAVGSSGSVFPMGGARWMRREVDRPYFWWDFSGDALGLRVPSAQVVEGGIGPNEDPCDDDADLVCLGLLYGLGDFAKTPAQVLGFLATTGIGVIALMMLAAGLGIAGSTALVGSRRFGSAATVGRAG
ncbi:MAG: hypothetical protein L0206_10770 [Actinobacteria bacterium]|nr:hypothetical protein [Actinomycetota bacterium]